LKSSPRTYATGREGRKKLSIGEDYRITPDLLQGSVFAWALQKKGTRILGEKRKYIGVKATKEVTAPPAR